MIQYKQPIPIKAQTGLDTNIIEAPEWFQRRVAEAEANKAENKRRRELGDYYLNNADELSDYVKGLYYKLTANANENPGLIAPDISGILPIGKITKIPTFLKNLQRIVTMAAAVSDTKSNSNTTNNTQTATENTTTDNTQTTTNNSNQDNQSKGKDKKPKTPINKGKWVRRAGKAYAYSWAIPFITDIGGNVLGAMTQGDNYDPSLPVTRARSRIEQNLGKVAKKVANAVGKHYTVNPEETKPSKKDYDNFNQQVWDQLIKESNEIIATKQNGNSNN